MNSWKTKNNRQKAIAAADAAARTVSGTAALVLRILLTVLLVLLLTGLLFTCIFAYYVKTCLVTDLDVKLSDFTLALSSTIWYKDENGEYQELETLAGEENRIWTPYDEIPAYMEHAAVAIEDRRFYDHKGVDWYRTAGAFANMFLTMKNDFGGSTITQQLIKNVTQNDDVTVQRKLVEIFKALELEKTYDKQEIIEWYLNVVYFGEGCYGVYTAAETYFGKTPAELSLAECASIIGITNNPSRYDPFISRENNKQRQELILHEMYDQGYITYEEYTQAVAEELDFVQGEDEEPVSKVYSYYVEVLIDDVLDDLVERKGINRETARLMLFSGGYQIYCSMNKSVQDQVDQIYENLSNLPKAYRASDQQLQSAIVVMDPYTGEIIALSGGTGEKTASYNLNRAVYPTRRPPGSSIKPIAVYGPAMEYGLITQTTEVNDAPDISLSGTTWFPRNSGGTYRGVVTIRQALISSLNTVSAQILDKLTPAASYDFLTTRLGVTSLEESDCDYAPLALGQLTHGITVREMAQAYCAFVNDGVFTQSRMYTLVTDAAGVTVLDNAPVTSVAFKESVAHNMVDMLHAAATWGTGSEASFSGMPVAGKTGTTTNNCDRWFVGFTPYYVAAVWTGYDMPEPMYFYGNPAAQIWKAVMQPVHAGLIWQDFPKASPGAPTGIFGDFDEEEEEPDDEQPDDATTTPTTPTTPGTTQPSEPSEPATPPEENTPADPA